MTDGSSFSRFQIGMLLIAFMVVRCSAQQAQEDQEFFNGNDLTGWEGELQYWSVDDGVIVGESDKQIPNNKFLWSNVEVRDFYLSIDVRMPQNDRNAGIQFRSARTASPNLQAIGYQADVGKSVWGRLYHEHGRGKLDWTDRGEKAVRPGQWNRYEILAVGHRIWTAINGQLSVAVHDPGGERSGHIALQIHSGQPQRVEYRINQLIHNPKVSLAGLTQEQLSNQTKLILTTPPAPGALDFEGDEKIGVITGDVSLVDTAGGGKAIRPEGRGSSVTYKLTDPWQVGRGPFSLSVWVKPDQINQAGILCAGGYSYRHGWLLDCHPDGSVRLETATPGRTNNGQLQSPGGVLKVGQWSHIVVIVDGNRNAKLLVDAKQVATGRLGSIDLTNPEANLVVGAIENHLQASFQGTIDRIGVWKKTLTREEISQLSGGKPVDEEMLPGAVGRFADNTNKGSSNRTFGKEGFGLQDGDTVVFVGGANMVRSRLDGTLEGLLTLRFAEHKPRFRNMAWEGDTVYEQWRDIDFGSWTDQLSGVGATVLIVDFGQMEAIEGVERLGDFVAAYEKLLDEFQQTTRRIVLLTPRPFEKPDSPHMLDHSGKNAEVQQYAEAIAKIAKERQLLCVDLFTSLVEREVNLTRNGIHLQSSSHPKIGRVIALSLGGSPELPGNFDSLLVAIREKNRLWYDNWRPMNWSFAFGDRTNQPFGKSFKEHPPLKTELTAFKPLIQNIDQQIQATAVAIASGQAVPPFAPVAAKLKYPQQQIDPSEHTPQAELASFTPADGFEVNLFAEESDGVVKPVQMRWDDRGRLWVACIPTYPHIEPGAKPGDYIIVCEDTDGDGRADKFTRFAEGLFIAMGIEFGDGGVYVSEATDIVFLKDTDGDGRADSREIILSGFGTADSHQMVNNIHRGPCGDLWFTQGHHAYSRVETPWGISKLSKAGVWRYRPGTGQLDGFFDHSKAGLNCQGITHDDWAQTFHNSAALSGGFYTVAGAVAVSPEDAIDPIVNPPERNTGIEFVGTEHLPAEMQGEIIWSGFMNNNLQRRRLVDAGSGFMGEKMPNLLQSSSRSFRPVNAKIGPDGAIYICDWYNPTIGHYQASYRAPERDRTRGRIWRLSAKGRPLSKAPTLTEMTPKELLDQLRSKERLTRVNATKRLFDLPAKTAIEATRQWIQQIERDDDYERMLISAAGIYAAHEVVNPDLLQQLITADDPRVRAFGARLVGRWNDRLEAPLDLLRSCIGDEHPRVRLEALIASSHLRSAKAMEVAAMISDRPRDHYLNYAMRLCVRALKPYWAPALARGEFDFGTSPDRLRLVLEMDGTEDSAQFIRQLLSTTGITEEAREGLFALLAGLGTPEDLQYVMDNSALSPAVLRELVVVAQVHRRRPSGNLDAAIAPLLSEKNVETRSLATELTGLWNLNELIGKVSESLADEDAPPSIVQSALVALGQLDGSAAEKVAMRFAQPDRPARIQVAAVQSIIKSNLHKASELAASLLFHSDREQLTSELVGLFLSQNKGMEKLNDAVVAQSDVTGPLGADAALLMHRALTTAGRTDVALLDVLNQALGTKAAAVAEYSASYVKQLADEVRRSGNAARGRKVYESKMANCAACHRVGGTGGNAGPDLSLIGAGRSEAQLTESVLWPNRQIREGYMAIKVLTFDGLVLTGLPVKETDEELHLRETTTGKIRRIALDDIDAKSKAGSIMPASLTAGMTRNEVRDLIRYLSELRGTKRE